MDTSRLLLGGEWHADGVEGVKDTGEEDADEGATGESICSFNLSKSSVNTSLMKL